MSIRLRLTLLYTGVLAVTLLVLGGLLYYVVDRNLHDEIDRSLQARVGKDPPGLFDRGPGDQGGEPAGPRLIRGFTFAAAARLGDPAILIQLNDARGQVISRSPNLNSESLPVPKSRGRHFETQTVNRNDLRILVVPISSDQLRGLPGTYTTPLTLLLARPLGDVQRTLGTMRVILLAGSALCLGLAAVVGYLMARGALRPIDRLTSQARGIGRQQDFKRRIVYNGPSDEVGRLAGTFNGMLDSLDSAHEQQRRALEAQRRFVADASHELRTPLTTIRGNVELLALEAGDSSPDQREALDDIASEAERMSRLVTNLLALARADGGLRLPRRPVEVQPVIAEVVQKASRLAGDVRLEAAGEIDASVLGDRDYLVQLLVILVDNALKYTPAGGSVAVSPSVQDNMVLISVRDTGAGIAPADQARVFDRFYRADPSRHGEGTGLGLAIAAWIAGELGGRIELQSTPGAGSTFTVVLPAERIGRPRADGQPAAAMAAGA